MKIIKTNLDSVVLETVYWVKERKEYDCVNIVFDQELPPQSLLDKLNSCGITPKITYYGDFVRRENEYCLELHRMELTDNAENSEFTFLRNYPSLYAELTRKYNLRPTGRPTS